MGFEICTATAKEIRRHVQRLIGDGGKMSEYSNFVSFLKSRAEYDAKEHKRIGFHFHDEITAGGRSISYGLNLGPAVVNGKITAYKADKRWS